MSRHKAIGTMRLGILMLLGFIGWVTPSRADRAGWIDPPGGWDIVMEGHGIADRGWINGNVSGDHGFDSDPRTWNDNWDPDDVTTITVSGAGDTEDGVTTTPDAIVLQLQDNYTASSWGHGRRFKFCHPFPGTYDTGPGDFPRNPELNVVNANGGVTIVMRFRVVPGTLYEPDSSLGEACYRADIVGGDASDGDYDRFGLGVGVDTARWCSGDDTLSTNIAVGDLTTDFRTFWMVFEPAPSGDLDNWMGTLYVDGSTVPLAAMSGPGDMGADGLWTVPGDSDQNATENWFEKTNEVDTTAYYPAYQGNAFATFGPGRTPAMITIQYDYICYKLGAHHPGPPRAGNVDRLIPSTFSPGTPVSVKLVASPDAGGPLTVVESVPSTLTLDAVFASIGSVTTVDNTITWTLALSATSETLVYDITPPVGLCSPKVYKFAGHYTPFSWPALPIGGESELHRVSDGWENAPIPWSASRTIGDELPLGRADWYTCDDSYEVYGSGHDIWNDADDFHFLYMYVVGDFTIQATVDFQNPLHRWSKAGLMARANNSAGSPYILFGLTQGGRDLDPSMPGDQGGNRDICLQQRDGQGLDAISLNDAENNGPARLHLSRTFNTSILAGYDNLEGVVAMPWHTQDMPSIPYDSPVLVGLAVSSHQSGQLARARFSSVNLAGRRVGFWIDPSQGFASMGSAGGPFAPSSTTYTVTNLGTSPQDWTTTWSAPWVTVSPSSGTLDGEEAVAVTVALAADGLPVGSYMDSVTVENMGTGETFRRTITLDVYPPAGDIHVTDTVLPGDDLAVPFGQVVVGRERSEQVTIENLDGTHAIDVTTITLMGTYSEDYNDGQAQGFLETTDDQWQVVAGEYRARASTTYQMMQSFFTGQTWVDCSAEVTMRRTGYEYSDAALAVRATDDFDWGLGTGSAYWVAVTAAGYYSVAKRTPDSGFAEYLQQPTYSTHLNTGTADNIVRVDVAGSEIEVYFNGSLAWTGVDYDIVDPGRVGFLADSGPDPAAVHYFDDLTVTIPPPQLTQFRFENLPPSFPATVLPGSSFTFTVAYAPTMLGSHSVPVTIESNDLDERVVSVLLSGEGVYDELVIKPYRDFESFGPFGGPFTPILQTYTLSNAGTATIDWSSTHTQPWLSILPTSGQVSPGVPTMVYVRIDNQANALPVSTYSDVIGFRNETNGVPQTRSALLTVVPDYMTEMFATGETHDLNWTMLVFTPAPSPVYYDPCRLVRTSFPTDPSGGTILSMSDDSSQEVVLSGGRQVTLFGVPYSSFFVGSNGYITFGSADYDFSESLEDHFRLPRISGLFDDLYPPDGGTISWKQTADRVAVTWDRVPEISNPSSLNSFQLEMFFDGVIRITSLSVGASDGLVGLSRGQGVPPGFAESDLSTYGSCDAVPPSVASVGCRDANPTSQTLLYFTVAFSESVTGFDTLDCQLATTGVTAASIVDVYDGPTSYTVAVMVDEGDGEVRLDIVDNDSILDPMGNPLGGPTTGNGDFRNGEVYLVDTTPPATRVTGPLGTLHQVDPIISLTFDGADAGTGMQWVLLFYRHGISGPFQQYGSLFVASPIAFNTTMTGGDGTYQFYTRGIDDVGNLEDVPLRPDLTLNYNVETGAGNWPLYP